MPLHSPIVIPGSDDGIHCLYFNRDTQGVLDDSLVIMDIALAGWVLDSNINPHKVIGVVYGFQPTTHHDVIANASEAI